MSQFRAIRRLLPLAWCLLLLHLRVFSAIESTTVDNNGPPSEMKKMSSSSSSSSTKSGYLHRRRKLHERDPLECKVIRSTAGNMYFIMGGAKHKIDDESTLNDLMLDNSDISNQNISERALRKYRSGQGLNSDWRMMNDKDFYRWANKVHHCTTLEQHMSHTSDRRVLLVMVDNRPLNPMQNMRNASYFPLNAVINFQYAKRHNYDFVIFRMNSTDLVKDVKRDYHQSQEEIKVELNASDLLSLENYTKNRITLYNPAIKEFRGSPWAKLPSLLYIMDMLELDKKKAPSVRQYDDIFYLDSDAAFVPRLQNRTISDFYEYWSDKHLLPDCKTGDENTVFKDKGSHQCGVHINNASMVFFSNALAATYPCTGLILLKTDQMSLNKELLLDWWNQKDAVDNFDGAYEQSTFMKMVISRHRINQHFAYMHGETEFLPCEDQWICHLSHYFAVEKVPMLQNWLANDLGIDDDHEFDRELTEIMKGHVFDIPSLSLTEYIENFMNLDKAGVKGPISRDTMYGKWHEFRAAQIREESLENRVNGTVNINGEEEELDAQVESTLSRNQSNTNSTTLTVGNSTWDQNKQNSSVYNATEIPATNSSNTSLPLIVNATKKYPLPNTTNTSIVDSDTKNTNNTNTNTTATILPPGRSKGKRKPTIAPTLAPSIKSVSNSSKTPSSHPTARPSAGTVKPTINPTALATIKPSSKQIITIAPTVMPTMKLNPPSPSKQGTAQPSGNTRDTPRPSIITTVTTAPLQQVWNYSNNLVEEGEDLGRDFTRYTNESTTWIENNLFVPGQTMRNETVLYSIYSLAIIAVCYMLWRICCRCFCCCCAGVETISATKSKKQTYLPVNTMEDLLYDDDLPDRKNAYSSQAFEEEDEEEFMGVGYKRQQGIEMNRIRLDT